MTTMTSCAILLLALATTTAGQRAPPRPATSRPVARPRGAWVLDTSRSPMTDELEVTVILEATNKVPGVLLDTRPSLSVRCKEGALDVIVLTGSVLSGGTDGWTDVRLRWGTATPEEARWSRSTNYAAAFSPEPRAFIAHMIATPDLRFEFTPFDGGPLVAIFDGRGLRAHMPVVDRACPFSMEPPPAPEPGGPEGDVYGAGMVDEEPTTLFAPQVGYPPLLRQARVEGQVTLQVVVDTLGRVEPSSIRVVASTNAEFTSAAVSAIRVTMFRPARLHGRPVRVRVNVPYEFSLAKEK